MQPHFSFVAAVLLATSLGAQELMLDDISVTATKEERATKDVPQNIAVVSKEKIEELKMQNIKEALQGIPGVQVDSKNGGYDVRLIIRGAGVKAPYGVREIMIMRDGVPMTDPDSFSRFDFIDLQDIERIEVTKGPGSIYGGGSAGGVIQIISKSVFDEQANRIRLGYGSYGATQAHLRYGGKIDEKNFLALTTNKKELNNGWRPHNKSDSFQTGLKYGHIFEDDSTLEAELSYTEANLEIPGKMSESQFEDFEETGEQNATNDVFRHSGRYSKILFTNIKYEKELGDWIFKPRLYANHWEHYHPVTGVINDSDDNNVYGTDLEGVCRHKISDMDGTLVLGATARADMTDDSKKYKYRDVTTVPAGPQKGRITSTLSDEKGELIETGDTKNILYGLYAQESLRPNDKTIVDIGIRYDRSEFDITGDENQTFDYSKYKYVSGAGLYDIEKNFDMLSAKIGATYALTDRVNVFASVSQSDQVPSTSEITGAADQNSTLDAATSTNYEIGLKGRGKKFSFDASVYFNPVKDEIVSEVDSNGQTLYRNAGKTKKKGFELTGSYKMTDELVVGASYAYNHFKYDDFSEGGTDYSGNYLPYIPKYQYSLFANYTHPSGFKGGIQTLTWGPYYVDSANSSEYDGYDMVTNLMAGYEKGRHALIFNINNLFDKHYAIEVKSGYGGNSYYPAEPRTIMGTYTYKF